MEISQPSFCLGTEFFANDKIFMHKPVEGA
jgi:hypothetical protein